MNARSLFFVYMCCLFATRSPPDSVHIYSLCVRCAVTVRRIHAYKCAYMFTHVRTYTQVYTLPDSYKCAYALIHACAYAGGHAWPTTRRTRPACRMLTPGGSGHLRCVSKRVSKNGVRSLATVPLVHIDTRHLEVAHRGQRLSRWCCCLFLALAHT